MGFLARVLHVTGECDSMRVCVFARDMKRPFVCETVSKSEDVMEGGKRKRKRET